MSSSTSTSSIFRPQKKPIEINVVLVKSIVYLAMAISFIIALQLTFAPPKPRDVGAGAAQSAVGHPDHFIVTGSMKALPGHESRLPEAYASMFGNPQAPPIYQAAPAPLLQPQPYYSPTSNPYQFSHPQARFFVGDRLKTVTHR